MNTNETHTAFNQWAEYLVAKTKIVHNNPPIIFSYCRDCGAGLGSFNGMVVSRCADAPSAYYQVNNDGEPCRIKQIINQGETS